MAEKPRIKLPKEARKGDVIQIKTLAAHIMENGLRKDQSGKLDTSASGVSHVPTSLSS